MFCKGYANTSEPSQPQDSSTPNRSRDATQTPDPQKPRSYDSDGMDESLGYRTPVECHTNSVVSSSKSCEHFRFLI